MLSGFELTVASILVVGDLLVLRAYLGPSNEHAGKRYPKRSFSLHALGGLAALVLGAVALAAYVLGASGIASYVAVGQGLAVVLFAGLFAFPMARHTSGFPGFNLLGYMLYTVAWMASAVLLVWDPSVHAAYACFVLTHAYLTCRVFVWLVETGWRRLGGRALEPAPAYSLATTIAALITLALGWGWIGVIWHLSSISVAIVLQRAGISSRWHAERGS